MSIYNLDRDGLRKLFYEFHKSFYGRTVFFFAYFIPFLLFVVSALSALFSLFYSFDVILMNISLYAIIAFVPAFILGNIYFYNEIWRFANYRNDAARRAEKKK